MLNAMLVPLLACLAALLYAASPDVCSSPGPGCPGPSEPDRDDQALMHMRAKMKAPCRQAQKLLEWKKRVIYQVITDRFALSSGMKEDTCQVGGCSVTNPFLGCNITESRVCQYGNFCGGSFSGIESKLDYIAGMNMDAIWISPIPENTECGFMGYWQSQHRTVSPQFGGEVEFKALISKLHRSGLKVVVDVVYNHFGAPPPTGGNWEYVDKDETEWNGNYKSFLPFNKPSDYHGTAERHCNTDSDPPETVAMINQTENQVCWLAGLADLNQSVPHVREQLLAWTKDWLLEGFGVDALRLDTVPYVEPSFYTDLRSEALGDTYVFGEVLIGMANDSMALINQYGNRTGLGWIAASMQFQQSWVGGEKGLGAVENYPLYMAMVHAFACVRNGTVLPNNINAPWQTDANSFLLPVGSLGSLQTIIEQTQEVFGTGAYGYGALNNFIENQDQPRFLFLACVALTGGNWTSGGLGLAPAETYACNNTEVRNSPGPVLLYMNALSILLMLPGVPSLIYGAEQGLIGGFSTNGFASDTPEYNHYKSTFRCPMWPRGYETDSKLRPLYGFTARIAALRRTVLQDMGSDEIDKMDFVNVSAEIENATDYVIAFKRGPALVVASNLANRIHEMDLQIAVTLHAHEYKEGQEVCDVLCYRSPSAEYSSEYNAYDVQFPTSAPPEQCDCVVVGKAGKLSVNLGNEPRVYLPKAKSYTF